MDDKFYNRVGGDRISSRQIDELIGLARGIAIDGNLDRAEVEFLQKWLAANAAVSDQPIIRTLYRRVTEILGDGVVDADESKELLETLNSFSNRDFELGELLKSTTLPLCKPPPDLTFPGRKYCFTGTFSYGQRKYCEQAVVERGGYRHLCDRILEALLVWNQDCQGKRVARGGNTDNHRFRAALDEISIASWDTRPASAHHREAHPAKGATEAALSRRVDSRRHQ